MARKINEDNERIKRRYLTYLREARRQDQTSVDKATDAILRFERCTGCWAGRAIPMQMPDRSGM